MGLRTSEIQAATGLPRSTAFRLVKEMSEKMRDILVSELLVPEEARRKKT